MEERLPESDNTITKPPGAIALETYVVQVPRDQIYRVPPPENARIVEEHSRGSTKPEPVRRSFVFLYVIPAVLIALITVITIITVRATVYRPITPEFAVTGIHGKNLEPHSKGNTRPPEFEIAMQSNNRNTRLSLSYREGGDAFLVFKDRTIGKGATSGAAAFVVVLTGNGETSSKETEASLTNGRDKSMKLHMKLPVEMNSWLRNESMKMKVDCDFRVHNSLMNATKILFQHCETKF